MSPVLRRALARIQASEAKNRKAIKLIVLSSFKVVLGLDLIVKGLGLTHQDFKDAIQKQWAALKYTIEREIDAELPLQDSRFRDQLAENDLENFVSQIQRILEVAGETATATVVTKMTPQNRGRYLKLLSERWNGSSGHARKADRTVQDITFLASNLGELVGFITFHARKTNTRTNLPEVELEDIYVVDHMRGAGVSYRMIREVIDYADQEGFDSVWFDKQKRGSHVIELFNLAGFIDHGTHVLAYKLDRLRPSSRSAQATA
jgi:GNAT superfamily N-acetyltransferase